MTKDEIIKIAQKVTGVSFPLGIEGMSIGMNEKHLQDFANAIMEAEREACAKVCEDASKPHDGEMHSDSQWAGLVLATTIRARGQK